jgi:outer membrane protein OmpA-like peptidoglycan-associated protein
MKYQLNSKFSVSLLAVAISGCSHWPEHGQGGDAQLDTSHEYYIEQVDTEIGYDHEGYNEGSDGNHQRDYHQDYDGDYDEEYDEDFDGRSYRRSYRYEGKGQLETQWSIHSLKLDTLVLRGGEECLPARVREVSMMAKRARRELDGNLLEDARNSLVIYQRELDELERRLIYIKRHTQCNRTGEYKNRTVQLTAQQKYQNRKMFLLGLLNDDYSFDVDSDQLTPHYREKLIIAANYLNQDRSIRLKINGHTDSAGDYKYNQGLALKRAEKVKSVLVISGVDSQRLALRSFGEQLPIESNSETLGRMKNRRVMVEFVEDQQFYIPGADGLMFEQRSSFFGFTDEDSSKVKNLKHWHKKIDSNAKNISYEDSGHDAN